MELTEKDQTLKVVEGLIISKYGYGSIPMKIPFLMG